MSNSSLATYKKLSPNHSGQRNHSIDRISPHCVVGQASVESLGNTFSSKSKKASSNYGIGVDGRIGMYVEEHNRSFCTSSSANDNRAVTIECASDTKAPYAFKDIVYNRLIDLCVDICKRNGKTVLLWIPDKNTALNYKPKPNEMVITIHRWFANKACPGDWLVSRLGDLANKVTARLNGTSYSTNSIISVASKPQSSEAPFTIKVTEPTGLNIRKGPGTNYSKVGTIPCGPTKYTIIEVNGKWGKLKSQKGWICLNGYTQRC